MSDRNCARANTTVAFEAAGVPPEGRFMMLPVPAKDPETNASFNDYYVVDETRFKPEYNGDSGLMHNRLDAAYAVVFTKSWLQENGLTEIAAGGHGADGSVGVAIAEFDDPLDDETLFLPFFSLRQNMGDREEKDQILRGALNAYFDSKGYDQATRERLSGRMKISVSFAASASLKNFAHQVQLPETGSDKEAKIRAARPDLIERADGRVTTAIVLDVEYAGAMLRGNVWPGIEAQLGIGPNPISPDRCPGDGQTCNVDYRAETEYAIMKQLTGMGVPEENIHYDAENVLDPADPANNMASNRREQNGRTVNGVKIGVATNMTNRTLNAMVVEI